MWVPVKVGKPVPIYMLLARKGSVCMCVHARMCACVRAYVHVCVCLGMSPSRSPAMAPGEWLSTWLEFYPGRQWWGGGDSPISCSWRCSSLLRVAWKSCVLIFPATHGWYGCHQSSATPPAGWVPGVRFLQNVPEECRCVLKGPWVSRILQVPVPAELTSTPHPAPQTGPGR